MINAITDPSVSTALAHGAAASNTASTAAYEKDRFKDLLSNTFHGIAAVYCGSNAGGDPAYLAAAKELGALL